MEKYQNPGMTATELAEVISTNPIPAPKNAPALDPETERALRGEYAIAFIRDDLEAKGFRMPHDYKFKAIDKADLNKAASAVFELIGGVPALMLFAYQNPAKFYDMYFKYVQDAPQVNINANSIQVVAPIQASPLDDVELDELGRVKNSDPDIEDIL